MRQGNARDIEDRLVALRRPQAPAGLRLRVEAMLAPRPGAVAAARLRAALNGLARPWMLRPALALACVGLAVGAWRLAGGLSGSARPSGPRPAMLAQASALNFGELAEQLEGEERRERLEMVARSLDLRGDSAERNAFLGGL